MEVEDIFLPAKGKENPQSLNVTFKNFSSISKIYEKTRIMRKDSRITNYIPRQFQDRLKAISEFDYNLRIDRRYQTRIKMGQLDLELHKKLRGTSKWEKVTLPENLPPVDLSSRPAKPVSDSPPPGRPGHESSREKRERESSGSDSEQNIPKVAKQGGNYSEVVRELIKHANLVSDGGVSQSGENGSKTIHDPGNFTSVQGTPVKPSPTPSYVQSPILSRAGKGPLL